MIKSQRLPLSISSFREIRTGNYLYIDKTRHAYELVTQHGRYFLARPRRFGKSLLVSTLEAILASNRALFDGLWISQSDYQWYAHGVITLDFSSFSAQTPAALNTGICRLLERIAKQYTLSIKLDDVDAAYALDLVTHALYDRFGRVAILIDEYDSPILRALQDQPRAKELRDLLHGFFSTIKSLGKYVDFVFITGVSSLAKAGIFSG